MDEMKGIQEIQTLRSKWMSFTIAADLFISIATAFFIVVLVHIFFPRWYGWAWLSFLPVFGCLFFMQRVWAINERAVLRLLDQTYPQLEESSGLLLRPLSSLNLLEQLQYRRTTQALAAIEAPLNLLKRIVWPAAWVGLALIVAGVCFQLAFSQVHPTHAASMLTQKVTRKRETVLPAIASNRINITPPNYTGKSLRTQHTFNLVAETGSQVAWQLQTSTAVKNVSLIFNEKTTLALHSSNAAHTQWQADKKIDSTGFYQVSIDGTVSELYTIETIPDHSPVILLQSPQQYTTIDMGEPQQVQVRTTITDDYGIAAALLQATIASGSGEAVKFRQHTIAFPAFSAGKTQYQLQQLLSLPALGMQPGDELYFYVQATDNHQQQTRSDVYIVQLPDTAQLMSLDGLANNLSLKPEYFRSERQIIIETEQLLKDKDTISAETFKNRSNNLGIDQKLLRLRYSKFLGEENETGEDGSRGLQDISDFSNADKVRDAYTDKHDNAEDATFFEPATKKQLQATLAEMWKAEIPLRTFSPQAALPFEYKALRLLKDLQQQSRAYVAKTNFKTTPLDEKKRLTGDVSKVDQPVLQQDTQQPADGLLPVRQALAVLEQIKLGDTVAVSIAVLQQANLRLHEKAVQQPAQYLPAAASLKRIMTAVATTGIIPGKDILVAEHGLQQMLAAPERLPAATNGSGQALSKQYFQNLQKKQP